MAVACLCLLTQLRQFDRQKDDSDLTQINIYQFTLTRDNMTVLAGTALSVEMFLLRYRQTALNSFCVQPTKDGSKQQYNQPLF